MKTKLFFGLLSLLIAALFFQSSDSVEKDRLESPDLTSEQPVKNPNKVDAVRNALEKIAERNNQKIEQNLKEKPVQSSQSFAKKVNLIWDSFEKSSNYFNSDDIKRRLIMEYFYADSDLKNFSDILSDPANTLVKYPENSAKARVLAIQVLRFHCEEGRCERLEGVLNRFLNHSIIEDNPAVKGLDRDFDDLAFHYLQASSHRLADDPVYATEDILTRLDLGNSSSERIRTILDDRLYFWLKKKLGREKAKKIMRETYDRKLLANL